MPTFVAEYRPTGGQSASASRTASVTTQVGDCLVCWAETGNQLTTFTAPTGGTSLTWTLATSKTGTTGTSNIYMWTATATTAETFTFTLTATGGTSSQWMCGVPRFTNSAGFGAAASARTTGAPTLNITSTAAGSALVVANADWVPVNGSSRVWRTNAGALTETYYELGTGSNNFAAYAGYHAKVDPSGTYAVGLSAPTGQTYSIAAVEVLDRPPGRFLPFFGMGHHHEPHDQLAARRHRSGLHLPPRRELTVARAA